MAKGKEAGQGWARPVDKGKGKEATLEPRESKPIKPQAVAKEKKATSGNAVDPPTSQIVSKKDPPSAKA